MRNHMLLLTLVYTEIKMKRSSGTCLPNNQQIKLSRQNLAKS